MSDHVCPICGQDLTCPVCFGSGIIEDTGPFFAMCTCHGHTAPPTCPSCGPFLNTAEDAEAVSVEECMAYFSTARPCPQCRGEGYNSDACGV